MADLLKLICCCCHEPQNPETLSPNPKKSKKRPVPRLQTKYTKEQVVRMDG